jgi:hypothetical protein
MALGTPPLIGGFYLGKSEKDLIFSHGYQRGVVVKRITHRALVGSRVPQALGSQKCATVHHHCPFFNCYGHTSVQWELPDLNKMDVLWKK